jgi:hypothetical protein
MGISCSASRKIDLKKTSRIQIHNWLSGIFHHSHTESRMQSVPWQEPKRYILLE